MQVLNPYRGLSSAAFLKEQPSLAVSVSGQSRSIIQNTILTGNYSHGLEISQLKCFLYYSGVLVYVGFLSHIIGLSKELPMLFRVYFCHGWSF